MSMAFNDIKVKEELIRSNRDLLVKTFEYSPDISLQELILKEIDLNVVKLNGKNNKKKLSEADNGTWKWTYFSVMR